MDSLWAKLFNLLERELALAPDPDRVTSLSCRLALLTWDLIGDLTAVERWLAPAEPGNPQALELRRELLLEQGQAAAAAELLEQLACPGGEQLSPSSPALSQLLEAALLRLFWLRDFPGAAALCRRIQGIDGTDAWLGDLVGLVFSLAGDTEGLLALGAANPPVVSALIRAGLVTWDRERDRQRALKLLDQAHRLDQGDPFVLELLLEVQGQRPELLDQKLSILSLHDPASAEARLVALEVARLNLDRPEELPRVAELMARVDPPTEDVETTSPRNTDPLGWAALLVAELRRDLAAARSDGAGLASAYEALATLGKVPALVRVYRLRAAQALELQADGNQRAEALLAKNFDENPADPHSARALEERRLRDGRLDLLCAQYEEQATVYPELRGLLLRKAAVVAEAHRRDRTLAASLRREGLAHLSDPSGLGDLQRHYRALGSDARLVEAYARQADTTSDAGQAALLWDAVAVLHLKQEQHPAALEAARDALRAVPDDPLALGLVAAVHRAQSRQQELRETLQLMTGQLQAPQNRSAALRELASLEEEPGRAMELLQQAQALQADDPELLRELSDRSERSGDASEAARWGLQLAEALRADHAAAAAAMLRVGRLRLHGLADLEGATEALEAALALSPELAPAMRELLVAGRRRGDPAALLTALQRMLPFETEAAARGALLLETARTLEALGRPEEAINSYGQASLLEPARPGALAELDRLCRATGRLDLLVQILGELPEAPATLEQLARLLEELGHREGLIEVLGRLLDLSTSRLERATRSCELAGVLEQLGRSDAVVQYEQALTDLPGHQPALQALQRIYRSEQRGAALVRVLEQELEVASDPVRRAEILLELGRNLEEHGRADAAIRYLEESIQLAPGNAEALWRLERLYDPEQPLELARILRLRAELETGSLERSALYQRAGLLLMANQGEEEAVIELLDQAFRSEPGNREAFTTLETLLYQSHRLTQLNELYDRAIHYVEAEAGRAYRPVDLYSRKGQLQLNHLGQLREAGASYLKALEYDPKSEAVMKMLEAIYLQQQDWLGLVRAYQHRAQLVPNNELFRLESLRQAGRMAISRLPGVPEEAERIWEEVYRLDPIDEEALENLESIYQSSARLAKLADLLEHRAALLSSEAARLDIHFQVGKLAEEQLDDPERAARAYENVRRLDEHNEPALKSLARIYEATGRWRTCLEVLRDLVIIEADPDERSLLYFKCGSILETHFKDDEEAIACYELALKEAAGCLPALHGLRDLHLRREDWNRALETLELEYQIWQEERERAGIMARMGEIRLQHLRDLRKATEHFEDALAVDPDCYPAALALFNIAFERGDSTRALELAEDLAQRMAREGDPEARSNFYCRRGQLLASAGHLQVAAESLVVALELRPKNIEALDWLIALCRRSPEAYDFAAIFRELEQVYRREGDQAAVGHVLVAAGALAEIAGDAETALGRYREAIQAAPQDLAPVRSLCDLLIRLRRAEEAASEMRELADRAVDPVLRRKSLLRLADLYSVACLDAERAAAVYREVLAAEPDQLEAADRLAQEYLSLGRLEDAYRISRGLLERATSEVGVRPRELSAFTQSLGVILLQRGDQAGAMEQFRRALQLDERNPEAAMSLARQLVLAGDREGAERLLRRSLALLGEPAAAALEVRRSLAGIYLGAGRFDDAVACYEVVVEESGLLEDRLTLAEMFAQQPDGIAGALAELQSIIDENGLDRRVLYLIAQLCDRSSAPERALQVLKVIETIGGLTEEDAARLQLLRRQLPFQVGAPLGAGLRRLLSPPLGDRHVEELWRAVHQPLDALFPQEVPGKKAVPLTQLASEPIQRLLERCGEFFGALPQVLVAKEVPGGVLVSSQAGGRVILDELLLERPLAELAFLLGRSFEYLRSEHGLVSRLAFDDRLLLCELLEGLLHGPQGEIDLVQEFRRGVARRTTKQIDQVAASYAEHLAQGGEPEQPARWLAEVDGAANRQGLFFCDEIGAALRMLARLGGQDLAIGPAGEVSVQLVAEGPELVRFFLGSDYLSLRGSSPRRDLVE